MKGSAHILETLRAHGVRLTPQRVMILEIIATSGGHITADEIYARAQAVYPYIDLSTVYRTLEFLKEYDIITETDFGAGRAEYELMAGRRHHHLVCRRCGEVIEVDHSLLEPLQSRLLAEHGFAADMYHFAIFGTCRECRAHAESAESMAARQD